MCDMHFKLCSLDTNKTKHNAIVSDYEGQGRHKTAGGVVTAGQAAALTERGERNER